MKKTIILILVTSCFLTWTIRNIFAESLAENSDVSHIEMFLYSTADTDVNDNSIYIARLKFRRKLKAWELLGEEGYTNPDILYLLNSLYYDLQAETDVTDHSPVDLPADEETITWGIYDMKVDEAWDISTGKNVIVAVLDTGIDYYHPELYGQIYHNEGEIAGNGIDDDGNGFIDDYMGWDFAGNDETSPIEDNDVFDSNGHGTSVAGIIASKKDNGFGIAGVAPEAKILPVKVTADNGMNSLSYLYDIWSKALDYAVNMGAKVINISMGVFESLLRSLDGLEDIMDLLKNKIKEAVEHGAIIVAGAGNESDNVEWYSPANKEGVVVVSSITENLFPEDPSGNFSSIFSNWGKDLAIGAPGEDILTLTSDVSGGGGDEYIYGSGTSFSAGFISGFAALMAEKDPALTYYDFMERLHFSSVDIYGDGWDIFTGWGKVDAHRALTYDWSSDQSNTFYDGQGRLIKKTEYINGETVTTTYYHETGRLESRRYTFPDEEGNVYYHYMDNDLGLVDKATRKYHNEKGELSFTYTYDPGTNKLQTIKSYIDVEGWYVKNTYAYGKNYTPSVIYEDPVKNGFSAQQPQINSKGDVVWVSSGTIYFYTEGVTKEITTGVYPNDLKLNDEGFIAWYSDNKVYLYDGASIKNISGEYDISNGKIELNNNGEVAFYSYTYSSDWDNSRVYLYNRMETTLILDKDVKINKMDMNNNGYMVWEEWEKQEGKYDSKIFFYDGTIVQLLTDNGSRPRINNRNVIVWTGSDANDSEIYLYDGINRTQLTDNDLHDSSPQINEFGQIAWKAYIPISPGNYITEIYFYDGSEIKNLTDDELSDKSFPIISDNGYVCWYEDGHFFLYDGLEAELLSDSIYLRQTDQIQINANGRIVWGNLDNKSIYLVDTAERIYETSYNTYYPGTFLLESKTLTSPDESGYIYHHYTEENFNETGIGNVDIVVFENHDKDGAIAYQYEYYLDSTEIKTKRIYQSADYEDPSTPVLTGLLKAYWYDENGTLIKEMDNSYGRKKLTDIKNVRKIEKNSHSSMTWTTTDGLFYFNNITGEIKQLRDRLVYPEQIKIYDNDIVSWVEFATPDHVPRCYYYNPSTEEIIAASSVTPDYLTDIRTVIPSEAPNNLLDMNENGDMAWVVYDPSFGELLLFYNNETSQTSLVNPSGVHIYPVFILEDGSVIQREGTEQSFVLSLHNKTTGYYGVLDYGAEGTDTSWYFYDDIDVGINTGSVVWVTRKYSDNTYDLHLYQNDETILLVRDSLYSLKNPNVSEDGFVVWMQYDGNDYELYLYDGETIIQLTDNEYDDRNLDINSNNEIVWEQYDGHDYEICLYKNGRTGQITDNSYNDTDVRIYDNGEILWKTSEATGGLITWEPTENDIYTATTSLLPHETTYYSSGRKETTHLTFPDDDDNTIYYHYIDDELNLMDISQLAEANENGEIAFEYTYYPGTDIVHFKYSYTDTNRTQPYRTYEYDETGNLVSEFNYLSGYLSREIDIFSNEADPRVWLENDGTDNEIFYYDSVSGEIKQLTDNDISETELKMDENGNVIWLSGNEVWYYDALTGQAQIIDVSGVQDYYIRSIDINAGGIMIYLADFSEYTYESPTYEEVISWLEEDELIFDATKFEVYSDYGWPEGYDDLQYKELGGVYNGKYFMKHFGFGDVYADIDIWGDINKKINFFKFSDGYNFRGVYIDRVYLCDNGNIIWQGDRMGTYSIEYFHADTGVCETIENVNLGLRNQYFEWDVFVNNNAGIVVWSIPSFETNGYSDMMKCAISLYNDGVVEQITDYSTDNRNPEVSDNGYVVWERYDGHDYEICLYDGETTIQLTNNDYDDRNPHINANNNLIWESYDGNDYEIYVYNGTVIQLTDNLYDDTNAKLNDDNSIFWKTSDGRHYTATTTSLAHETTYYSSGRKEFIILVSPDNNGNIYYHYIDNALNLMDISHLAEANENDEIAFHYEYYTDQPDKIHKITSYSTTEMNPEDIISVYEYDTQGGLILDLTTSYKPKGVPENEVLSKNQAITNSHSQFTGYNLTQEDQITINP